MVGCIRWEGFGVCYYLNACSEINHSIEAGRDRLELGMVDIGVRSASFCVIPHPVFIHLFMSMHLTIIISLALSINHHL